MGLRNSILTVKSLQQTEGQWTAPEERRGRCFAPCRSFALPVLRRIRHLVVFLLTCTIARQVIAQDTVSPAKSVERVPTESRLRTTTTGSGSLTQQLLEDETPTRGVPSAIFPAGRAPASPAGAIAAVAAKMAAVEKQIRAGQLGSQTRALQSDILLQLEKLIDQSEQRSGGSTSAQQPLGTDAVPSVPDGGEPESSQQTQDPELFNNRSLNAIWGHLPRNLQQLIRNPLHEDFLPSYRRQIEDYYRRLSER